MKHEGENAPSFSPEYNLGARGEKKMRGIICALAGAVALAGSAFAQAPDIAKIKADAEAGNAKAQGQLGEAYMYGAGIPKDEAAAVKWMTKAAEAGDGTGQARLGQMLQNGWCGLTPNPAEAVKWFTKAAEQGHPGGQSQLGQAYLFGKGVAKDEKLAAKWLALAAKGGVPSAQGYYAYLLGNGLGVERNLEEALAWCKKGAAADDPGAKQTLPYIQRAIDAESKTPKSFLGITFGDQINTVTKYKATKTSDGTAVSHFADIKKPFRKFQGSLKIFGTVMTGKIFMFTADSKSFPNEATKEEVDEEFQKTCDVIAKKFETKFEEVKQKKSSFSVREAECLVGMLRINLKVEKCGTYTLKLAVTHMALEKLAKQEVKAEQEKQGDGSDAL